MRVLIRLVAAALSLALIAAGALLVVEIAGAWLNPGGPGVVVPWPRLHRGLGQLSWNEAPVVGTSLLTILAGLILLLFAARSARDDILLHDPAPGVRATTNARSVARLVGHRVREQDGVASAMVTAGRGSVRVRAKSTFSEVDDVRERVVNAAEKSVNSLPLRTPVKVSVYVAPAKERS